jgi:hypothetical protein
MWVLFLISTPFQKICFPFGLRITWSISELRLTWSVFEDHVHRQRPCKSLTAPRVLQDAAVTVKDAFCELKCRLSALNLILPLIPEHADDLDKHSAPACGPPPAGVTDLQKPFKILVTEVSCALHIHQHLADSDAAP